MAANRDVEKSLAIEVISQSPSDDPTSDREDLMSPDDEFTPPDGGLLADSGARVPHDQHDVVGYPATFGVYQLYYRDVLKLPESQISWIGSVQIFLTFATCAFSGRLADAGFNRSTLAFGSSLVVLGTFMTSLCTQYWQLFLAQGVCIGLGLGNHLYAAPLRGQLIL